MKCPNCGYKPPPKKPVGKPQKFTAEEKRQIVEDKKTMTLLETASKWKCSIGTIQNMIKCFQLREKLDKRYNPILNKKL